MRLLIESGPAWIALYDVWCACVVCDVLSLVAGHHIMEARWMRDNEVANSYIRYFFEPQTTHAKNFRDPAHWSKADLLDQYFTDKLPKTCLPHSWRYEPRIYTTWYDV